MLSKNQLCRRCGESFDNPYPEIKNPEGNNEIATVLWCDKCNELTMNVLFRDASAYRSPRMNKDG